MKKHISVIITGIIIGIASVILVSFGNPGNMGFCIACFERDIAGALRLQNVSTLQYLRPEIIGLVLGSFIISLIFKEFKPRSGASPMVRFVLGFIVMVGALMFLGCPLRMLIRLGGGDLNAVIGLVGFIVGIALGVLSLKKGFTLGRTYKQNKIEGASLPAVNLILLSVLLFAPTIIMFSNEGPGSLKAPISISLLAGLIVGAMAQRSRFCTVGGIRDVAIFKDFHLLWGSVALVSTIIIANLILGKFNLGFQNQPVAHTDGVWNFLGLALVGWGSVLLGGCPLRQLILSGEGNSDSSITVLGMLLGAAVCHNFSLASSLSGPTSNGKMTVIAGFILIGLITVLNIVFNLRKNKNEVKTNA